MLLHALQFGFNTVPGSVAAPAYRATARDVRNKKTGLGHRHERLRVAIFGRCAKVRIGKDQAADRHAQ